MKIRLTAGIMLAIGAWCASAEAQTAPYGANPYGSGAYMPAPQAPPAHPQAYDPYAGRVAHNSPYSATPAYGAAPAPTPSQAAYPRYATANRTPHEHVAPEEVMPGPGFPAYGPAPTGAGCAPLYNPYTEAMQSPWDSPGGYGCGPAYGGANCPRWFGGVYGLYMTRDDVNETWFSYDSGAEENQLNSTEDVSMRWSGGFEVRLGYIFGNSCAGCGCTGVEVVYWGLFAQSRSQTLYGADMDGSLDSMYDFQNISYPGLLGDEMTAYFDNSEYHRLRRSYNFHNVEVNLLQAPALFYSVGGGAGNCGGCGYGGNICNPGGALSVGLTTGVRYFRFEEGFGFYAGSSDPLLTDEAVYSTDCTNDLVGWQFGTNVTYQTGGRWSLDGAFLFGIYANYMTTNAFIGGPDGPGVINDVDAVTFGESWDINASKTGVSFLGEARLGAAYAVTPRFRLTGGYRVVAVTGLALPTNQIPPDFRGTFDVRDIQNNGNLVLHGIYAGGEFVW